MYAFHVVACAGGRAVAGSRQQQLDELGGGGSRWRSASMASLELRTKTGASETAGRYLTISRPRASNWLRTADCGLCGSGWRWPPKKQRLTCLSIASTTRCPAGARVESAVRYAGGGF
jgi:hypothetical protein